MLPLLSRSVRKFRGGRGSEGVKNGKGYFYVDCRSEALVGIALSDLTWNTHVIEDFTRLTLP